MGWGEVRREFGEFFHDDILNFKNEIMSANAVIMENPLRHSVKEKISKYHRSLFEVLKEFDLFRSK